MMQRAQETQRPDNHLGWGNRKASYTLSEFDIQLIGLIAEYAVVKVFGGTLKDCDILTRGTGKLDDGIDLTLPGAVTAQVKGVCMQSNWTRPFRPFWALRDRNLDKFVCDVGILVLARCDGHAEILGYVTRQRFIEECREVNLSHGDRLGINALHMDSFDPLVQWLKRTPAGSTTSIDQFTKGETDARLDR